MNKINFISKSDIHNLLNNKFRFKKVFKIIRKYKLKKIIYKNAIKQKILNEKLQNDFFLKTLIIATYLSKDKIWPWPFGIEQIEDYILTQTNDITKKAISGRKVQEDLMWQFRLLKRSMFCYKDLLPGQLVFVPMDFLFITHIKYLTLLIKEQYPPPNRVLPGRRLILLLLLVKLSDYNAWLNPIVTTFFTQIDYLVDYLPDSSCLQELLTNPLTNTNSFLFWTFFWIYIYTPIEGQWIIWRTQRKFKTSYYYYTRWDLMDYYLWYYFLLRPHQRVKF